MHRSLSIGGRHVGDGFPCFITFEAGPTHDGVESALQLVEAAAEAGANAVKFQIFDPDQLIADKKQQFSYSILLSKESGEVKEKSESLYEIFQRRSLTREEWHRVKKKADEKNIAFFATVGSLSDFQLLEELGSPSVKIASSDIDYLPLLRLAAQSKMCVQLDTGNAEIDEIAKSVSFLEQEGCNSIIIHQCPSGYPARLPSICLNMIKTLKDRFPMYPIAYSDHTPDADMDLAAVALGANLIEKTITLDRCTPSVEHIFSLEPSETMKFIARIRDVEIALGDADRKLTELQKENRRLLRRSPYLTKSASAGESIHELSVNFARPGLGLTSEEWFDLLESDARLNCYGDIGQMLTMDHFKNEA